MKWEGEYKVKCPKCGCRVIRVDEHIDARSEHLIVNGVWDHEHDNNEYGDYTFTIYKCMDCGHVWKFKGTMDKYLK